MDIIPDTSSWGGNRLGSGPTRVYWNMLPVTSTAGGFLAGSVFDGVTLASSFGWMSDVTFGVVPTYMDRPIVNLDHWGTNGYFTATPGPYITVAPLSKLADGSLLLAGFVQSVPPAYFVTDYTQAGGVTPREVYVACELQGYSYNTIYRANLWTGDAVMWAELPDDLGVDIIGGSPNFIAASATKVFIPVTSQAEGPRRIYVIARSTSEAPGVTAPDVDSSWITYADSLVLGALVPDDQVGPTADASLISMIYEPAAGILWLQLSFQGEGVNYYLFKRPDAGDWAFVGEVNSNRLSFAGPRSSVPVSISATGTTVTFHFSSGDVTVDAPSTEVQTNSDYVFSLAPAESGATYLAVCNWGNFGDANSRVWGWAYTGGAWGTAFELGTDSNSYLLALNDGTIGTLRGGYSWDGTTSGDPATAALTHRITQSDLSYSTYMFDNQPIISWPRPGQPPMDMMGAYPYYSALSFLDGSVLFTGNLSAS